MLEEIIMHLIVMSSISGGIWIKKVYVPRKRRAHHIKLVYKGALHEIGTK